MTPFPTDLYRRKDSASTTGGRIDVMGVHGAPGLLKPMFDLFGDTFATDLALMDGFGTLAFLVIPLATRMDPETVPEATGPGEGIEVVAFDADGIPYQAIMDVDYEEYSTGVEGSSLIVLQLFPRVPLAEKTRHLVLIRRSLTDATGTALQPYPMAEVLLGTRQPYGPAAVRQTLVDLAEQTEAALDAWDAQADRGLLAAAFTFTTGSMESELFQAGDAMEEVETAYNLDPDEDGTDNVFLPGEYDGIPGSEDKVARIITGEFRCANFRNEQGHILSGQDGEIAVQGHYWRPFWLVLPAAATEGPVPIVFAQHGINSWKETMHGFARRFAGQGWASGCFDFLHHAKGTDGGFKFLKVDRLAFSRDNFRQTALDYVMFVRTARRIFEENQFLGDRTDGVSGSEVDFSMVVFSGHSLGAIESTIALSVYGDEASGVLLNAGGNLQFLMEGFLKSAGLYDIAPGDALVGFKIVGSQLFSAMDPAVFAPYLVTKPRPGFGPVPHLLLVSTNDETIYPECGFALTKALGTPLLDPAVVEWPHVQLSGPEGLTSGTVQFAGSHEMLAGSSEVEMRLQAEEVYFHYIHTWFQTGTPQIIWPPSGAGK